MYYNSITNSILELICIATVSSLGIILPLLVTECILCRLSNFRAMFNRLATIVIQAIMHSAPLVALRRVQLMLLQIFLI